MSLMGRGRVASWSREQYDNLSTPELRALMANAERLNEPEVAALCSEILDKRPRGHAPAPRGRREPGQRLLSRNKAFEEHGITPKSRIASRSGLKADGRVLFIVRAADAQKSEGGVGYLLWSPIAGDEERKEHCRIALEAGSAAALLSYEKERVDASKLLTLRIEQRGQETWGVIAA